MKNLVFTTALFFILGNAAAQSFEANQIALSFDTLDGEKQLVWETPREVNTSYFIVYKSEDGTAYEQIGRIQAKGSCAHASQYKFTDLEASIQASYKVVLVTMEGLTTSSAPLFFLQFQNDALLKNQIASKPSNIK